MLQNDRNIGAQQNNSSVYNAKGSTRLYTYAQIAIALSTICIFKNCLFVNAFYNLQL